jgi:hypothetical protein
MVYSMVVYSVVANGKDIRTRWKPGERYQTR